MDATSYRSVPVLLLVVAGTGSAADWPTLRGSDARSGFYPAFAGDKLRLAWRHELYNELTGPGPRWSSPAVWRTWARIARDAGRVLGPGAVRVEVLGDDDRPMTYLSEADLTA